jgi:hypothetical protein
MFHLPSWVPDCCVRFTFTESGDIMFLSERSFRLSFPQPDRWVQLPSGADGPRVPMPLLLGPEIGPLNLGRWGGRQQLSMGGHSTLVVPSRPPLLFLYPRQQTTMGSAVACPANTLFTLLVCCRVKCLHSSLGSAWLHWYLQICAPPYQSIGSRISWPFSYFIDSVFALMQVTILVALGFVRVIFF